MKAPRVHFALMISRSLFLVLGWLSVAGATAATSPIYTCRGQILAPPDVPPQIDATVWVNECLFQVNDSSLLYSRPYRAINNLFFTNTASGHMSGTPGFQWDFSTNNTQGRMTRWVNLGTIESVGISQIYSTLTGYYSEPNWLMVSANNICNSGLLNAGAQSRIRLDGKKINLNRSGIRTGAPLTGYNFYAGNYLSLSNYYNDLGITDLYWGTGTNNYLNNRGQPMRLDMPFVPDPNFVLPYINSPYHQVIEVSPGGLLYTNIIYLPGYYYYFGTNYFYSYNQTYTAHAYTNRLNPTNLIVQVVFVPTNSFETNITTDVRFYPGYGNAGGALAVVAFSTVDQDIVMDQSVTNSVYVLDALAFETNVFLARNYAGNTRRPATYEITKGNPFYYSYGVPGNTVYTNTLLYDPLSYTSNTVPVAYAAYGARIDSLNTTAGQFSSGLVIDPTNFPGRVEISGDEVSLEQTRVRADSTFDLYAGNLTSNRLARVNAPYVNFDVGSTQPQLLISNLASADVHRLSGTIGCWSAIWVNYQTNDVATNRIQFHVLIVDPNLQALQPVVLNRFCARVTNGNLMISDNLNVRQTLQIRAKGLDVEGALSFPPRANWASSNVIGLLHLTNNGLINTSGAAFVGSDRPQPYSNYINHGTNLAIAHYIEANNFQNTALVAATGGALELTADTATLLGNPTIIYTNVSTTYFTNQYFQGYDTNGLPIWSNYVAITVFTNVITNSFGAALLATGDLDLTANSVLLSNAVLQAGAGGPGVLTLSVADQFTDAGLGATNFLYASAGIQCLTRPTVSDLLGTYVISRPAKFAEARQVWAGRDCGATVRGFSNNLALGKLTLDGAASSLFSFFGTGRSNALYVDYLELLNNATNYNTALAIDPGITIYFANANIPPEKLDGRQDGHLRWVSAFTGPLSSTNFVYADYSTDPPTYHTYTFNIALVQSRDRDDDADGIVNADDPTPFYVGESVNLKAAQDRSLPSQILISWDAMPKSTNYIEYKPSVTATNPWQVLKIVTNNATVPTRLTVSDPVTNRTQRVYRVRVDTPPLP